MCVNQQRRQSSLKSGRSWSRSQKFPISSEFFFDFKNQNFDNLFYGSRDAPKPPGLTPLLISDICSVLFKFIFNIYFSNKYIFRIITILPAITVPAITLTDHRAVYKVRCRCQQPGDRPHADKSGQGEESRKTGISAEVLSGQMLNQCDVLSYGSGDDQTKW